MDSFNEYLTSLNSLDEIGIKELQSTFSNLKNKDQMEINELIIAIPNYDLEKLMFLIQPLWNDIHLNPDSVSEKNVVKLFIGIKEYKKRGLDMEYLTQGAGAPGNCTIL